VDVVASLTESTRSGGDSLSRIAQHNPPGAGVDSSPEGAARSIATSARLAELAFHCGFSFLTVRK
jgi:hypothetical protein